MVSGSIVAIITPMQEDGSLDIPRFRSLIDFHIGERTDAIVVNTSRGGVIDTDALVEALTYRP